MTKKKQRRKKAKHDAEALAAAKIDAVEAFRIARDWVLANKFEWQPGYWVRWEEKAWHISTNSDQLENTLDLVVCPNTGQILSHVYNPGG